MPPLSPPRWTVSDAIDFEHLLAFDGDDAVERHVAAFATATASMVATVAPVDERGIAFLAWVRFVRERAAEPLPGTIYDRARGLATMLLTVAGILGGGALAGSLLARRDAEPVNALLFLGWTVGLQVAFLLMVAIASMLRAARVPIGTRFGPTRDALLTLVRVLGRWIGRGIDRLDGARRDALRARWATLDLRSARLAPLIGCDLVIVTQRFAMAFNVGLLAAMLLLHLPFEELRFGWQSTYSFTTAGVETAVRATAAPWSWASPALVPGLVPSAADIAATRFARGQRAETLPADAAHAWWPFLIAAIVVYGFAMRALLALAATLVLRRRLRRLTFTQPAANALWRRLAGPLMRPTGGTGRLPDVDGRSTSRTAARTDLLIVDREATLAVESVPPAIERRFGGPVGRIVAATIDDDALSDELVGALRDAGTVVVATGAGRDPIVAVAGFLRALAERSRDAEITVVLIPDGTPDAVPDERFGIWQRFVAIQRLRVGVERAPT